MEPADAGDDDAGIDSSQRDSGAVDAGADAGLITVEILDISDWHGQLDPLTVSLPDGGVRAVAGAPALAAYFASERANNPQTLIFTAGDAFGGTPPLSAFFK